MKRNALIRDIRKAAKKRGLAFEVVREGAEHTIFRCGLVQVPVPRHRELGPKMEFEIRVQLEPALGHRWWR
jgi:hypothetical protein